MKEYILFHIIVRQLVSEAIKMNVVHQRHQLVRHHC